ncbi:GNAT family N-acetyltransferase [Mesobacillus foraminis]|uniref:Acetyltransferase (GNAT) family protein n=1 Tax=Mesobacillus foraminis TaxID=279826 RepID=A0A4R2BJ72_9BACI|nr:GNAT family N-acetyltransferase [Mesobacillus foraminis]TCN26024.1 acetyltransferase (GNAT) family protein [Mesobacillus foraminis]
MNKKIFIKELSNKEEWLEALPVMKQLRTHLDEAAYLQLIEEAAEKEGYKMAALFEGSKIAAVIGFMPMITLYNGRFIWVCDLVTHEERRSKGYGKALLQFAENWAQEHDYKLVSLSSGLQREEAHRFYQEKMEYDKVSYVFLKKL